MLPRTWFKYIFCTLALVVASTVVGCLSQQQIAQQFQARRRAGYQALLRTTDDESSIALKVDS